MIVADVMQALADRLDTIAGLRVYAHPPEAINPPAAVVSYPDSIDYDQTYGRGMDRMQVPVVVLVKKLSARVARDDLTRFVDGTGPASVKAVLESGTYTAFHTIRVSTATVDVVEVAGIDYLAVTFMADITGSGA